MKSFYIFVIGMVAVCLILVFVWFRTSLTRFFFDARDVIREGTAESLNYATCKEILTRDSACKTLQSVPSLARETGLLKSTYTLFKTNTYSRYPFNDKSLLVIQGGSDENLALSMPVMYGDFILAGRVTRVSRTQSEVQTIFDPSWKSSVYIGASKIKAVLKGGENPTLELIPKDAVIAEGDVVVNSSPDFPLGVFIGTVSSVSKKEHDLWAKADLRVGYSFDDVRNVSVITNFP